MKKLIVFILAIFYLSSSTGVTVNLHYCMGKLVNWGFHDKSGDKCDKCGMKKDGGCCKDESQLVKNNIDQKTAESSIQLIQSFNSTTSDISLNDPELYLSSLTVSNPINHLPPLKTGVDILLHNCVFRI